MWYHNTVFFSNAIFDNLYINTNHTAVHSVWLIQDLLDFYCVDKENVTLLIKRPPSIEPQEVKDYITNTFGGAVLPSK